MTVAFTTFTVWDIFYKFVILYFEKREENLFKNIKNENR